MLFRKITTRIEEYLSSDSDRMLLIDGARQIGKSYIIRHVGEKMFPNYIEINMEEDKLGDRLFAEAKTTKDFYMALSVVAGDRMKQRENTLVFIDEIQAYDHLLTLVKFLMKEKKFTYIASGSLLGVTLKNTQSVPMGSLDIQHMYPMDFEEFLYANGVGEFAVGSMRESFNKQEALSEAMHNKLMDLFKKYLLVGGLPKAVETFVESRNVVEFRSIQKEAYDLYGVDATKYEEEHDRKLKIRRIFDMIPSNLENKKKRVVIKDIEDKKWKRSNDYLDEFDYLIDDADNLSNIPIEVKSGKDYSVHSALDKFMLNDDYNIKKAYVLSNERNVYLENGIIYMPIYYVMFFQNTSNVVEEFPG